MSNTTPGPDETPVDPTAPAADHAAPATPPQPANAQPQTAQPPYAQPGYAEPGYAQQLPPAYPPPGTAVAGPNPISPSEERTVGMIAHAGTLAAVILSGGTLGFIVALVIYLIYKDRGPFVRHHAANAVNVQILGAILVIGGILLTITVIGAIIGIPMIIVGGLYVIIVHIIGAVKANNGEWYNPPMTPQFVR